MFADNMSAVFPETRRLHAEKHRITLFANYVTRMFTSQTEVFLRSLSGSLRGGLNVGLGAGLHVV